MLDSAYLEILKDSTLSHFALTVSNEFVYPFALSLGKSNNILASAFALVGSVIGLSLTYWLFYGMARLFRKAFESNPGFPAAKHYINKLSPIFGILMAVPQLAVIPPFFFGLTRMNYWKFLILAVIYRTAYYSYVLIYHLY